MRSGGSPPSGRVLGALVAAALVTALTGCGDQEGQAEAATTVTPATATTAPDTTTAPSTSTSRPVTTRPPVTTAPSTTTTTVLSAESIGPHESLAARSDGPLDVYGSPDDAEPFVTLAEATDLGTPRVVRVLEGPVEGWMRVQLPMRPNGSEGWVRAEDTTLFKVDRRVEVDLGDRTLRVVSADGVLLETAVAVGGDESPTPPGTFYVTDSVVVGDPGGPWGPHAFGLSAYSDTITEFNGADGIIGIHGTNNPSSIGQAASLGCVRVPNQVALELAAMISAGVVVTIEA